MDFFRIPFGNSFLQAFILEAFTTIRSGVSLDFIASFQEFIKNYLQGFFSANLKKISSSRIARDSVRKFDTKITRIILMNNNNDTPRNISKIFLRITKKSVQTLLTDSASISVKTSLGHSIKSFISFVTKHVSTTSSIDPFLIESHHTSASFGKALRICLHKCLVVDVLF